MTIEQEKAIAITSALEHAASSRVLVIDGAMGTMIQAERLDEAAFRGERFADSSTDLKGNNDLLNLTRPSVIDGIHNAFLEAGADIIETNTFNATALSQAEYGTEAAVAEINREGARIARRAADAFTAKTPDKQRFVAGALGPTSKTASISPDVTDPGYRAVSFDQLKDNYKTAARALVEGGVDILLVETIFDTLNAKAALFGVDELFDELGAALPVIVSGTITDLSGRNLSGQTVDAFWISVRHVQPFAVGLNCGLGAEQMRPYLADLARIADARVSAYPNAGLPNEFGEYDEPAELTARLISEWLDSSLCNLVGGCCGTTPAHIAAISAAVAGRAPRSVGATPPKLRLSGLEPFEAVA